MLARLDDGVISYVQSVQEDLRNYPTNQKYAILQQAIQRFLDSALKYDLIGRGPKPKKKTPKAHDLIISLSPNEILPIIKILLVVRILRVSSMEFLAVSGGLGAMSLVVYFSLGKVSPWEVCRWHIVRILVVISAGRN